MCIRDRPTDHQNTLGLEPVCLIHKFADGVRTGMYADLIAYKTKGVCGQNQSPELIDVLQIYIKAQSHYPRAETRTNVAIADTF